MKVLLKLAFRQASIFEFGIQFIELCAKTGRLYPVSFIHIEKSQHANIENALFFPSCWGLGSKIFIIYEAHIRFLLKTLTAGTDNTKHVFKMKTYTVL